MLKTDEDEVESKSHEENLSPRGVDELGNLSGISSDEEEGQTPWKEDGKDQSGSIVEPTEEVSETDGGEEAKTEKSVQDKALRKPDKPVSCPRCESLETKFCYFNNYNVNQPRHFCKNCQRYWTAGGTLRNVPVGAGRRKNKHLSSHQRQSLADGGLIRGDDPNAAQPLLSGSASRFPGLNSPFPAPRMMTSLSADPGSSPDSSHQSSSLSSTVTSLTREMPMCGDYASSWKMFGIGVPEDQAEHGPGANARQQERMNVHTGVMGSAGDMCSENGAIAKMDATSSGPLEVAPDLCVDGRGAMLVGSSVVEPETWQKGVAFPPVFGGPWPLIYGGQALPHVASWPAAAVAADGLWQLPHPPLPFPVWNSPSWSFPWSLPWGGAAAAATATAAPAPPASVPPSQQAAANPVGKRPRVAAFQEGSLCIPKTLRINDPDEAARSSIWATLGVSNRTGSLSSGGFFSAFQPKAEVFQAKADNKMSEVERLHSRNANPAASARAAAFQECK